MIVQLDGWDYLDRDWLGEAWGVTQWLRLASDRDILRSIAFDLLTLPRSTTTAVLTTLQLPLRPGMTIEEVTAVLGRPVEVSRLVPDRTTLEFHLGSVDKYLVGSTVHDNHGLVYLTVHPDPLLA